MTESRPRHAPPHPAAHRFGHPVSAASAPAGRSAFDLDRFLADLKRRDGRALSARDLMLLTEPAA